MRDNLSVLIVDDLPEMIDVLGNILSKYKLRVAINGERALKIANSENPPDLILLDIVMPEMDGYEVCKRLKANQKTKNIPVIFVSGLKETRDEAKGLALGAVDYMTKPFKPALVRARVKNHLELKLHQDKLEELVTERTEEIVERLVLAAESRDTHTGGHIKRIKDYTILIAKKFGLPDEEAEKLGLASTMHDIGKIGIPDDILLKPGKLDENEWDIMKRHPGIGANNLQGSSSNLLEMAKSIALSHHERWDGNGYPAGLRGNEIPLYGRIVCLVDVFDALASKRPYKKALDFEETIQIIRDGRGVQFDPDLVDLFIESITEIKAIFHKYSEV